MLKILLLITCALLLHSNFFLYILIGFWIVVLFLALRILGNALARNQESSPQKWYSGKRFIWKAFTPKGNGIWREKEMASALCTKASRLLRKKRWQLNVMYKYVEVGLLGAYAVELHASSSLECLISILNLHLGVCFLALKCGRVNKGQSFLLAKYVCEGDKI